MTDLELLYYFVKPEKKIELFLVNSSDKTIRTIVRSVIKRNELDFIKRELAVNLVTFLIKKIGLRVKLNTIKISPLRKLSEMLKNNFHKLAKLDHLRVTDKSLIELSPLELLSSPKIMTIIFYRKIKRVLAHQTIEFLESMLKQAETQLQVIISLLITLYLEYLPTENIKKIEKYFILRKDYIKTLILTALLYLLQEASIRITIVTKKPYFKNRYLANYSVSELPIGTKLVVIDKLSSYYRARKIDEKFGRTYTLHTSEAEVVEKKGGVNIELREEIKRIIKEIINS